MRDIVDTIGSPEFFCEALAHVDRIGPNRRLVFVVTQPGHDGQIERVVALKLVVPAETAVYIAQMIQNDHPEPVAFASLSLAVAN
jgi:hypothetical protein